MDLDHLISAAQEALGGLDRIRAIRTYHAEFRRVRDDGTAATMRVWRAAGGRIRIEERGVGGRTLRVAGGPEGAVDETARAEMLRDARIAPRNMLAHAAEHRLALRDRPAPDGARIVSFPAEFVIYLFRPETFLCSRMIDLVRDRRIEFGDYRRVDGVTTSFAERHVMADRAKSFADVYLRVEYNRAIGDDLFTAARSGP